MVWNPLYSIIMKYILLDSGQNGYSIAAVPDYIADNIKKYQQRFDAWLMDKNSPHSYWKEMDGDWVLEYDGPTAFIKWLEDNVVADFEKAEIVASDVSEIHF